MKNNFARSLVLSAIFAIGWSSASATVITTGGVAGTTTAASPLLTNINATPAATIRFDIGGVNYITNTGQLSVTVTVDATTPIVTTGTAANQAFKDDTVNAAFFGYYLSTGVRTGNQNVALNLHVKVIKGAGETAGRSYYLLGNGTTVPTLQSNLTVAPVAATTFASTTVNAVHCGPSYSANGISAALGCAGGATVANMDVTQFVKIAYTDPAAAAIISQLQFIAVAE